MKYFSENISGNLHDATRYINAYLLKEHPNAEVVTMDSDGYNSIVVWRMETEVEQVLSEIKQRETPCPICGGTKRCNLTGGKLGFDNLTKEQWAEVYRFITEIELPFLHSILAQNKRKSKGHTP